MSKWKTVKLGDVCNTTQGVQIPLSEQIDCEKKGYLQYLYIGDFKGTNRKLYVENKYLQKVVSCEDLVMANTGSPGAVFKGMRGILSNNLFKITFNKDLLCLGFLYLYLSSYIFQNMLQNKMKGGIQQHLGHKTIAEQLVPLPPLEEQKRIANILDKASHLIELRKQQLEKMDLLIKSKFIDMFGDPVTNPKGWRIAPLMSMSECFIGLTYKPEDISETGTVVLRSGNVQNGEINFGDVLRVKIKVRERLLVHENDILMCSRNGSERLVGKTALLKGLNEPMTFGAFMTIIRSDYYCYLLTYFKMEAFKRQIATSNTTTINQITKAMLDKIEIPLPPLAMQNQFVKFVEQVEKQKAVMQRSLEKMETNYKALMQEYFG